MTDDRQIKLLPEDVANKIAAGEVVERPASGVKELVENSLDAGARRVCVEIMEGGRKLISVSDDGCGMSREDAKMSLMRHATSKIRTAVDISNVRTLGFRGEALPSIASVSRFEMVTAPSDGGTPTCVKVEGGADMTVSDAARSQGTTISVKNLFFCVPVRAKFLKTDATELGHIARFMQNAVLTHPHVGFRYLVDKTEVFNLPPQNETLPFMEAVQARLCQLRGTDFTNSLIPVSASAEGRLVEGFVSPWTVASSTRSEIFLFVNKRAVRCVWMAALLKRAYGTLLSPERFPYAFLFLTVAPGTIDINVHPAKLDIRFRSEHLVQDLIARAVSDALRSDMAPPELSLGGQKDENAPDLGFKSSFSKPQEISMMRGEKLSVEDWKKIYAAPQEEASSVREKEEETYSAKEEGTLSASKVLAQAGGMYILAEIEGKGIGIIDQHAAHERINYEKALLAFESANAPSQRLLLPETLTLSHEQMASLKPYLDELRRSGFSLEEFGKNTLKIDAVPAFLEASALQELMTDMAEDLKLLGSSSRTEEIRRRLALVMVCRKSIKFHHQLSMADCQAILDELMATKTPWTCPHGRPTIIMLTYSELERRFGRAGL
ncbi:DNA mismatch repair endonuclease MutL [bacterium]|nr:DNA mismatch repair endonuclease MutL [bacterium]